MELINKTTLPTKQRGDGLSAAEINSLNTTVNSLVDYVNANLKKFCNLNMEYGDSRNFSLGEAISLIPVTRRSLGMTVRFLESSGKYVEYTYVGRNIDSSSWANTANWVLENTLIDGGVWR